METESQYDQTAESDQLGVVILWVDRPLFGRYGYLVPYRGNNTQAISYFDKDSLVDSTEPITEGALVHYQTEGEQVDGRIKAVNIQVERFDLPQPQLDFREGEVLCFPKLNPNAPLGAHLINGLSPETKTLFDWYHKEIRAEIPPELLKYLNTLIGGPLLFDQQRFAKIKLRRLTQLLLDKNPAGGELRWLNRLLLEDAYPDSFFAKPENVDCSAPAFIASVVERNTPGRCGCLQLSNKKRFLFSFDYFPNDDLVPQTGELVECRIYDKSIPYDIWKVSPQSEPSASPDKLDTSICGFVYDLDTGKFILPNGFTIPFEPRYAEVFSKMLIKPSAPAEGYITKLDYKWVAKLFERGRLKEEQGNLNDRELNLKLKPAWDRIDSDPDHAKKSAQEFRRQFGAMLRRNHVGFSVRDVIRVRDGCYTLGPGWDKKKMVIGGSEVSLVNEHYRDAD